MKRTIYFLLLFIVSVPLAHGAPSIAIQTEANPREITIGDPISFNLSIVVSSDVAIVPVAFSTGIGDFELLVGSTTPLTMAKDGKMNISYRFLLTTFSTGTLKIPALTLQFLTTSGAATQAITEEITIKVKSILEEKGDEGNLRPLKGLFDFKSYLWIWILLGILGIAAAVYFLGKWLNKRGKGDALESAGPPRPAEELAWEAIHALEDADLVASGQIKEFYYRLTMIVRDYIERRYGFSALDRTTSELLIELRQRNFQSMLISLFREVFENADLVKFAKFTPTQEEVDKDLNQVKQFINLTTPKKTAPNEEAEKVQI